MKPPFHYALASLALLSGCGSDDKEASAEGDPAMTGALEDQIMVDPALAGQNGGAAAAGATGWTCRLRSVAQRQSQRPRRKRQGWPVAR